MSRWRDRHEKELAEFNGKNELGVVRDAATFEWTLPDSEPAAPYDVLFVLPLLGVYGGVATVLELANALVLQGVKAGVVVFETVPPEIEMELFFRPLRLSTAELLERARPRSSSSPPATRRSPTWRPPRRPAGSRRPTSSRTTKAGSAAIPSSTSRGRTT